MRVSVVIVTYNRLEDLVAAIRSVTRQTHDDVEIVVVDNASTDGTVEYMKEHHPEVRLVALDWNAGATEGRNLGVSESTGELVYFLDSDATLDSEALARIVARIRDSPQIAVVGCKILRAGSDPPEISNWVFSEKKKCDHAREFFSFTFSECGFAIRTAVFEEVGGFWKELFFGREGEDLGLRVLDAGYRILHFPHARVFHRVSPSARVAGGRREYFDLRNSLYIYLVRYRWPMLLRSFPLRVGVALVRGIRRGYAGKVVRAVAHVVRHAPGLWKVRRPIRPETAAMYVGFQKDHGSLSWDFSSWLKHKT